MRFGHCNHQYSGKGEEILFSAVCPVVFLGCQCCLQSWQVPNPREASMSLDRYFMSSLSQMAGKPPRLSHQPSAIRQALHPCIVLGIEAVQCGESARFASERLLQADH